MERRAFGTIEKLKSGNYRAYWKAGEYRVRAPHTFPHKRAAQEWLAAQQTEYASGRINPASPPRQVHTEDLTLDQWQKTYFERCKSEGKLAPKSAQTYQSCYRKHLAPTFGARRLAGITTEEIRDWYNNFPHDKLGARRSAYRTLSALLGAAVSEGILEKSPAKVQGAMSKPKRGVDNPRDIVATPKQVQALAEAMPEKLAITVLLGFWCSMRFGEITELRRKDVEITEKSGVVHVRRAVQYAAGYGYTVGQPKTEAGVRDIAIPNLMLPALRDHLSRHVPLEPDALLVHSPASTWRWLSNNSLNYYFKKAVSCVEGLDPRFTFHGLRHSGLTYAGQCGATLAELLARAGHSDINTVLIYQHATRERDVALAERMSKSAERS